jgi:hypothetical protein
MNLNTILIARKTIQTNQANTHIFTNNLNNIFFINNHRRHPSSQQHPDKLLIIALINQTYWTNHMISIHKVKAHTLIFINETTNHLTQQSQLGVGLYLPRPTMPMPNQTKTQHTRHPRSTQPKPNTCDPIPHITILKVFVLPLKIPRTNHQT